MQSIIGWALVRRCERAQHDCWSMYGHYLLFSLGNMHRRMADDLQKSVTDKAVAH